MIIFENVTKKYGDQVILDDVDFEIEDGEFIFITGQSGAGKTTLLRLILKEELPDSGKVFFNTQEMSALSKKALIKARQKIGFIFQDYKLLESKNVFDNVAISLEILGKSDSQIQSKVPEILESVGLKSKINSFPWKLSGGEKQRLSIARALALDPILIVADEPTGNLDPATSWDILNLLKRINEESNTTVIVATHDMALIEGLKGKERVYKIENGKINSNVKIF
ncbi:ATP-binding cassette domain-containing protein [Patescibacteria group bacterium]|nr:ATP-binding cassette domain-containing protein [Patescibacteria group bacterium]